MNNAFEKVDAALRKTRQEMNERFDKREKTLQRYEHYLNVILDILQHMNRQLSGVKESPERAEYYKKRLVDLEDEVRVMQR